tara:strand:- start:1872 stop:2201 length:330 start_codon:yes stop_codon:yes gene_type:complete
MPHYYREEYKTEPTGEDETLIHNYLIKLSERDVDALQHLKDRNGAGIGNIAVENIALWKMINQVCEINTLEEDGKEWVCRYCGKSTFETEYDYLADQTAHLACALETGK